MSKGAKEVSEMLTARIEELCRYLLPAGKKAGPEWEVGSVAGEKGDSMKVHIVGDKAGVWADFASHDSGDALDLWAKVKGVPLAQALTDAKAWLGIREHKVEGKKTYGKPVVKGITKLSKEARDYLEKKRMLHPDVLDRYKIRSQGQGIIFPSFDQEGELIQIKWIGIKRPGGKKKVATGKNCAPTLFGWQGVPPRSRSILICEGEIDALTWAPFAPAVSVPFGAKNLDWIDYDWDRLQVFDEILLSFDMDPAGQEVVNDICKRLGFYRCKVVKLPAKDMNDWWVNHGPNQEDVATVLLDAAHIEPPQIIDPRAERDKVMRHLFPSEDDDPGLISRVLDKRMTFRLGETTLWSGFSSHGKTTALSNLMIEAAVKGEKVGIASMEMMPHIQIAMMTRQFYGKMPVKEEVDRFLNWAFGKIFILGLLGIVRPKELLELMEYLVKRHGCRHLVIDSLMKLAVSSDDFDYQRRVMNEITQFGMKHNVHVHLVAHPRKGDSDRSNPNLLDVKGSGDLVNQTDNLIVVWRNKAKEIRGSSDDDSPDGKMTVEKQRVTGVHYSEAFKFHKEALQFTRNSDLDMAKDWSADVK